MVLPQANINPEIPINGGYISFSWHGLAPPLSLNCVSDSERLSDSTVLFAWHCGMGMLTEEDCRPCAKGGWANGFFTMGLLDRRLPFDSLHKIKRLLQAYVCVCILYSNVDVIFFNLGLPPTTPCDINTFPMRRPIRFYYLQHKSLILRYFKQRMCFFFSPYPSEVGYRSFTFLLFTRMKQPIAYKQQNTPLPF